MARAAYEEQLKHISVEALDNAPPDLARRAAMNAQMCGLKHKPARLALTAELTGIPPAALGTYFDLKRREAIALCRLFSFDPESLEMKEIRDRYAEIDPQVRAEKRAARARARQDRLGGAQ
jgi:hypothetical protein